MDNSRYTHAYRGFYNVSHNGGIDGFISLVSLLPQENIGLVMLTNSDDAASSLLTDTLSKEIFDSLLDLKREPRVEKALEKYLESKRTRPMVSRNLKKKGCKILNRHTRLKTTLESTNTLAMV